MNIGSRVDQDSQVQCVQTSTMAVGYIFVERRFQLTQSCKEEGFVSLYHALLLCEMMDPSTSRSVRLACAGALNGKYDI